MEAVEEKVDDVLSVRLNGRLDANSSAKLEKQLLDAVQRGERRLLLDLGGLEYISSIGLRVLLVVAKRLQTLSGRIVICCLQDAVRQVFEISGFNKLFPVFGGREDALSALR